MRARSLGLIAAAALAATAASAAPVDILYAFKGGRDGVTPVTGLTPDGKGGFFGATYGPTGTGGPVWEISPPAVQGQPWSFSILYAFRDAKDGTAGQGGLLPDGRGGLYGLTRDGGDFGFGAVFELSPPADGAAKWTRTTLYSFKGPPTDGSNPLGGLVQDAAGALYGVTELGGQCSLDSSGCGTVFKLAPPAAGQSAWTETLPHIFGGDLDGAYPTASPIIDAAGNLYGTVASGGATGHCDAGGCRADGICDTGGCGVVYRLGPKNGARWDFRVIKELSEELGGQPFGGLARDGAGNLYGATFDAGRADGGTVFELEPPLAGKDYWKAKTLHNFRGSNSRLGGPYAGVVADADGALYGTAVHGGRDGQGLVFRLAPPAVSGGPWTYAVVHAFRTGHDGENPESTLVFGSDGRLYGTTFKGGHSDVGTVFAVAP